ncbi:MAG: alpha/beta hydrolase [Desulfobacteraceae bacterium]|nr:alpha/beta hydrolase [Desulfobacteraceae bacterium]
MSKLNGLIQLIQTAVDKGATSIEEVHNTILIDNYNLIKLIKPLNKITENIQELQTRSTSSVYHIIRLVNQAAGNFAQFVLEKVEIIQKTDLNPTNVDNMKKTTLEIKKTESSPKWAESGVSILNGVFGDYLHKENNALSTPMQFYHNDRPLCLTKESLKNAYPKHSDKLCILLHGLACNETVWEYNGGDKTTYGSLLQDDLDYTPIFLRYNTGLHISENGKMFSKLMSDLISNYPQKVNEIVMIGHSMGGLVIRSGCRYGTKQEADWVKKVKKLFYLAAPHHGAPMEKLGNLFSGFLKTIPLPYTRLAGNVADLRSSGIKDLRFGYLVDEDWEGYDPDAILKNNINRVTLQEGVSHYVVTGSLTKNPDHLMTQLFGDPMVRKSSAMGRSRQERRHLPVNDHKEFAHIGHIKLAHCHDVYQQIKTWCRQTALLPI